METLDNIIYALLKLLVVGVLITMMIGLVLFVREEITPLQYNVTNAEPIAQQKIGDDVNPDILIIYEAEVDGETVYPAVVKEAE